jgi:hypothetical protein
MSKPRYELVQEMILAHKLGVRTDSAAMLAGFLEIVWRLDPADVEDAICDGPGDKGIDGLAVDDGLREIAVFQAKWYQSVDREQSDPELRDLVGSAKYFDSAATVDELIRSRPRPELLNLLRRQDIRTRVDEGIQSKRFVFVTNGVLNADGERYVEAAGAGGTLLDVWDLPRLAAVAARTRAPELLPDRITLHASSPPTAASLDHDTQFAVALVTADQLVALPGIADLSLFARNVRLSVGRTRINKEIEKTIEDQTEHPLFPAYHNGLTMLTNRLEITGEDVQLHGITVVNGCQSLLALYEHRAVLTPELRVLVKVVRVEPDSGLTDKVTYRSNNQNPVDIRDQRSTDPIQRDLQQQVKDGYGQEIWFGIRAGELVPRGLAILDNQTAAQLILALYRGEPWNAVRKVRLFDQDYRRIFNRDIDAHHLYLLYRIRLIVDAARNQLDGELQASFAAVRLTIAHCCALVLRESEWGAQLLDSPQRWLPELKDAVDEALARTVAEIVDSVNFFVGQERKERGDEYDPKVAFKSRDGVDRVAREVLRDARRHAERDKASIFDVRPVR